MTTEHGLIPFRCPVCEGRGWMEQSFYTRMVDATAASTPVTCKSCQGRGIVWGPAYRPPEMTEPVTRMFPPLAGGN